MYEPFAEEFAARAIEGSYNALYDRPAVLRLAEPVLGRTVLDAGCGPGLYTAEFLRRRARVIGFDQSPTLVQLARQRVGDAATLRVHDLNEPLDWIDDDSIDLVVLALALNYVDDRVAMLREVGRVLRPGGTVVISMSGADLCGGVSRNYLTDRRRRGTVGQVLAVRRGVGGSSERLGGSAEVLRAWRGR